ncbi:LANO_0G05072g1_1 [Lachancea nothofagi CBS 11611]|uniref:LANO_0G05072g1_1 n=1 Tax=Lachancea nothofagi CBS 11611 TaxID=1266666 RepID=A0A1G4KGH0_9SACH|nr:LANO_0G05072g1_1 [Lachancea nothofagi CBS 11611]
MAYLQIKDNTLAVEALASLVERCSTDSKLANDKNIHMIINTEKPIGLKNDYIPRIVPLSNCKMHKPSDLRILLITKDPSTLYRKTLTEDPTTSDLFKTILSVRNLKGKYRGSRLNQLFKEYDIVVADYRVHHLLPKILGSAFYHSNKKLPFMIQMSRTAKVKREKLPEECDAAYVRAQLKSISRNTFFVPNVDNCLSVKIGEVGLHSPQEMAHNIQDIVQFLTDKSKKPQGGVIRGGISGIFVKTSNSASLPIFKPEIKAQAEQDEELRL